MSYGSNTWNLVMHMDLSLNTPVSTKQAGNTCMEHVFGHGCHTMDPKEERKSWNRENKYK